MPGLERRGYGYIQGIPPCQGGPGNHPPPRASENPGMRRRQLSKGGKKRKEKLQAGKENRLYKGLKRTDSTFQGAEETSGKVGINTHGEARPVVSGAMAGVSRSQESWQEFPVHIGSKRKPLRFTVGKSYIHALFQAPFQLCPPSDFCFPLKLLFLRNLLIFESLTKWASWIVTLLVPPTAHAY